MEHRFPRRNAAGGRVATRVALRIRGCATATGPVDEKQIHDKRWVTEVLLDAFELRERVVVAKRPVRAYLARDEDVGASYARLFETERDASLVQVRRSRVDSSATERDPGARRDDRHIATVVIGFVVVVRARTAWILPAILNNLTIISKRELRSIMVYFSRGSVICSFRFLIGLFNSFNSIS